MLQSYHSIICIILGLMNSFSQLRAAPNNTTRGIYALYILGALFYGGIAFFTVLRMITQVSLLPVVPPVIYATVGLYVILQFIVCYGFFCVRKWLVGVFGTHIVISIVTFVIVLPLAGLQELVTQSAISSLLYWALLLFTYSTREYANGPLFSWVIIALYALSMALLVGIRTLIIA